MYRIGKEKKLYNLKNPLSESACREIYDISQQSTCRSGFLDTIIRTLNLQQRSSRETADITINNNNGFQLDIVDRFEEKYNVKVRTHLHKLVIYSEGDFFNKHIDGPEWYGTVIGVLKSKYTGGKLGIEGEHLTNAAFAQSPQGARA